MTAHGYECFFGGDVNVLKLDCDDGYITLNILKIIKFCTFFFQKKFFKCLFLRERERERQSQSASGGGAEREGITI